MSSPSSGGKMVTLSAAMERPSSFTKRLALKRKIPPPPPLDIEIAPLVFQTDDRSFRDLFHEVFFGVNGFGVVSTKGKKNIRYVSFAGSSNKIFFGVYDGHESGNAVEFVAKDLHKDVFEMMKNCEEKGEKEEEEAFKAAYLKTDSDFLLKGVKSGASCVTVMIQDHEMTVSSLGGCRVVLCRGGGVAEALTSDHKAGRDDEQGVENQGGYVAVSGSVGDETLKKWVNGEPERRTLELAEDMEFLVLASDGFWEVVSNQEAVDTVLNVLAQGKIPRSSEYEKLIQGFEMLWTSRKLRRVSFVKQQKKLLPVESPKCATPKSYRSSGEDSSPCFVAPTSKAKKIKAACEKLANLAVSRGGKDDITVVIIDLNHHYKYY